MNRFTQDIENKAQLVNIGEVTPEDWKIMLNLSRVGRMAFLESLDEQRRDAYNDAEIMLHKVITTFEDEAEPFPIPYYGDKIADLI